MIARYMVLKETDGQLLVLRPYQVYAVEEIVKRALETKNNGYIWHTTGTGKTFTSIAASLEYFNANKKIFRVILVPFTHLIDQWESDLLKLGVVNIVKCSSDNRNWELELSKLVRDFNLGFLDSVTVITTYKSNNTNKFKNNVDRVGESIFLIADECHYCGTKEFNPFLFKKAEGKVGLSATPDRWWDEKGTEKIYNLFNKIVFRYDLDQAINSGFLVDYKYEPIVVDLTMEELEEYSRLTRLISIMIKNNENNTEKFKMTILRRQRIIDNAYFKEKTLINILKNKKKESVSDTLIYCTPQNIESVTNSIGDLGIKVRKFNYKVKQKDRQKILKQFELGDLQVITAIKCLDEGVDIPSVKTAYFLASTSNPKEFIQRRGRVLRKHKSKSMANIKDFIVLPSADYCEFESIAKNELPRFAEFSRSAINSSSCRFDIRKKLSVYNLEYLMDKLSWQVYKENKERWEYGY